MSNTLNIWAQVYLELSTTMWDPWHESGLTEFCSRCCELLRAGERTRWPEWKPYILCWDLIRGGCSSTWRRASCICCPLHPRLFGSTLGIGKLTRRFTILMHISGYLLNQAICSVKERILSQSKKKKKGLNVEHRKSTTQIKKLLKETRLLPLPPLFHLVDPSLVEFVVTSEYNSKFK